MNNEGGGTHGCLRRQQERDNCVVAGRTEQAVERFSCRTRACRRRLRRENVVNDWMSGRKKSKVVLFGVVTDEMPSEVKVNKRPSTADHSDMVT